MWKDFNQLHLLTVEECFISVKYKYIFVSSKSDSACDGLSFLF